MAFPGQGNLFGFSNQTHLNTLFDKNRVKAKTSKDQDAHDRDYAPLLKDQRYKREFDIKHARLKQLREDLLKEMGPNAVFPPPEDVEAEMVRRSAMVGDAKQIVSSVKGQLDAFTKRLCVLDDTCVPAANAILDEITKAFPQLQVEVIKIQSTVQGVVQRQLTDIERLRAENDELRQDVGKSMGALEISNHLEKFLQKRSISDGDQEQEASLLLNAKSAELLTLQGSYSELQRSSRSDKASLNKRIEKLQEDRRSHVERADKNASLIAASQTKHADELRRQTAKYERTVNSQQAQINELLQQIRKKDSAITELQKNDIPRSHFSALVNRLYDLEDEHARCKERMSGMGNQQSPLRDGPTTLAGVGCQSQAESPGFNSVRRPSMNGEFEGSFYGGESMSRGPSADSGFVGMYEDRLRGSAASDSMSGYYQGQNRPRHGMEGLGSSSNAPLNTAQYMQASGNHLRPPLAPVGMGTYPQYRTHQQGHFAPPPVTGSQAASPVQPPARPFPTQSSAQANPPQVTEEGEEPAMPFSFLVTGTVNSGQRIIIESGPLVNIMNEQIQRWTAQEGKKPTWSAWTNGSEARCIDTRRYNINKTKAPPANQLLGSFACSRCIRKRRPCVLIGKAGGPVIVPLPLSDRARGTDPSQAGYYLK